MWDEPGRAVERRSKRKKGGRGEPQEWKRESSAGVAAPAAYIRFRAAHKTCSFIESAGTPLLVICVA